MHFSKVINQQYLYKALKYKESMAFFSKLKLKGARSHNFKFV